MSTTTEDTTSGHRADEYDGPALGPAEHGHPSDLQYIYIALGLAVVTAIEVVVGYMEGLGAAKPALLIGLAIIKFVAVAGFFMHLKFDHKNFRVLFITGIVLALFCYLIVLFASNQFRF